MLVSRRCQLLEACKLRIKRVAGGKSGGYTCGARGGRLRCTKHGRPNGCGKKQVSGVGVGGMETVGWGTQARLALRAGAAGSRSWRGTVCTRRLERYKACFCFVSHWSVTTGQ